MADPADLIAKLHQVLQTCRVTTPAHRNAIVKERFAKINDLQSLEGDEDVNRMAKKLSSRLPRCVNLGMMVSAQSHHFCR